MSIDPEFALDEFAGKFTKYRQRYGEGVQRLKNDVLCTKNGFPS